MALLCNHRLLRVRASSVVSDSVAPQTVAHQAPPSMGFSRQEYWSGLLCSPPGALPDPGLKPMSLALTGRFFTRVPPRKPHRLRKPGIYYTLAKSLKPLSQTGVCWIFATCLVLQGLTQDQAQV